MVLLEKSVHVDSNSLTHSSFRLCTTIDHICPVIIYISNPYGVYSVWYNIND